MMYYMQLMMMLMLSLKRLKREARAMHQCHLREIKHINCRAVPDFGSGLVRNLALFPNLAEIRLRQESHHSRIVLPDLKIRFFPDIK